MKPLRNIYVNTAWIVPLVIWKQPYTTCFEIIIRLINIYSKYSHSKRHPFSFANINRRFCWRQNKEKKFVAVGLQSPSIRLFICGLQNPRVCQFILKFIDLLYDFQSSWWDWWIVLGQIRNIIILIRAFVDSCMHNTDCTLLTHWGRDKMVTILQVKFSICISLNENDCICIQNPVNLVHKGSIYSISSLIWVVAWHRICDKPLIEPMMTQISDACMLQRIQFRKLPLQFKYSYAYYVIKSNLISVAYLILNGSLEHMLVLCWMMKNNHCWPRVRNISFFPTCIKNFCATDISLSVLRIV